MHIDRQGRLLCLRVCVNSILVFYLFTKNLESKKLMVHLSNWLVLTSENHLLISILILKFVNSLDLSDVSLV